MNTKNLQCFMSVYEERNLTLAAAKLFLSPQGLGKIIRGLEEEFNTELFIRTKEGFIPTESGHVFYEKTKQLNHDLNDLYTTLENIGKKEKRFKLGFASGTIRALDISKIAGFIDNNPEILGEWHERDNNVIQDQVENGDINFGFIVGKPKGRNLRAVCVYTNEVVLYVYRGHRFFDREKVSIEDIKDERIVSMSDKYRIYFDVINASQMLGFVPNIVATVKEGRSIIKLVENKVGIGITPMLMEEREDVHIVRIEGEYKWCIYGICREDSPDSMITDQLYKIFEN